MLDDFQIAIREAGHTLAAFMLFRVSGSTIEFVNGRHGLTWSNSIDLDPNAATFEGLRAALKDDFDSEIERAHCHVVEWLAGTEAEKLFCETIPANSEREVESRRARQASAEMGGLQNP